MSTTLPTTTTSPLRAAGRPVSHARAAAAAAAALAVAAGGLAVGMLGGTRPEGGARRAVGHSARGFVAAGAGGTAVIAPIRAMATVDGRGLTLHRDGHELVALRLAALGRGRTPTAVAPGRASVADGTALVRRPGVEETYRATSGGVEQRWVVGDRPTGAGGLVLRLRVAGALRAAGGAHGDVALRASDRAGEQLTYGGLLVRDADGHHVPAHLVGHGARLDVVVDDRAARYPLDVDPTLVATLTQPGGGTDVATGAFVAQSDGGSVVVATGATSQLDVWTRGAGAVYAHGSLTVPQAAADLQSYPVAVSADGQVLVVVTVQLSRGSGPQTAQSTAHVYTGGPSQWVAEAPIDTPAVDTFVRYAELSADGTTLDLGTYPQSTIDAHRDFAFTGPPASWAAQTPVRLDGGIGGDGALAADGRTLAVGNGIGQGVRVYRGAPSSWPTQAPEVVTPPAAPDGTYVVGVGADVSMTPDAGTLVVRRDLQGSSGQGSSQLLAYPGGPAAWAGEAPTVLTLPAPYRATSVAVSGGCPALLVGASASDGSDAGAFSWTGDPSSWPAQRPSPLILPGTYPVALGTTGSGVVGQPSATVAGAAGRGQVSVVDVGAGTCSGGPTTTTTGSTTSDAAPTTSVATTTAAPATTSAISNTSVPGPPAVPPSAPTASPAAPVAPPAPAPAASTSATPPTAVAAPSRAVVARLLGLPATRTCLSRRTIRLRIPIHVRIGSEAETIRRATVALDGRTVARTRGSTQRATISLRGRRKARYRVTIAATTASGRVLRGAATYRTCARRSAR